jgi:HK97 family phage portal protein
VKPLVAADGSVFYELAPDNLSTLQQTVTVPSREIIHDRITTPGFHPLVGVSPLYACYGAALRGLAIQNNSTQFFTNGSNPGGVITAPGSITPANALAVKEAWDTGFSGDNFGKVAVLGDGMTYVPMPMSAHDSELSEQLDLVNHDICRVFHVPPFLVNVGPMPTYDNVQALWQLYHSLGLQEPLESIELLLDEGLELPRTKDGRRMGTEFDLDNLLRMDSAAQMKTISEGVRAGVVAPNEGRRKVNLIPKVGGDTPYLQHQDYSLEALARRDEAAPAPPAGQQNPNNAAPSGDKSFESAEWVKGMRSAMDVFDEELVA